MRVASFEIHGCYRVARARGIGIVVPHRRSSVEMDKGRKGVEFSVPTPALVQQRRHQVMSGRAGQGTMRAGHGKRTAPSRSAKSVEGSARNRADGARVQNVYIGGGNNCATAKATARLRSFESSGPPAAAFASSESIQGQIAQLPYSGSAPPSAFRGRRVPLRASPQMTCSSASFATTPPTGAALLVALCALTP